MVSMASGTKVGPITLTVAECDPSRYSPLPIAPLVSSRPRGGSSSTPSCSL